MADTKIVRGYSLSAANIRWLREQTLKKAVQTGKMSVSDTLDGMLTEAREKDAEGGKQKAEGKKQKVA